MAVQELPKGIDPDRIRELITQSRTQYEAIEQAWDKLLESHEDEWVASYKGQFAFGKSLEEVLAAANQQGWPLGSIAIDLLRRERADVLL